MGRRADGADYREFALPHTRRSSTRLAGAGVPTIHFGVGTDRDPARPGRSRRRRHRRRLAPPLDEAWDTIGADRGVQGNLDPDAAARAPSIACSPAADDVLRRAAGRPGHIFNLGHGVLPETPLERVQELARHVHRVCSSSQIRRDL